MIKLPNVIYDKYARDGTWCTLPYPNHPKGCPNFPKCPNKRIDFINLPNRNWVAVIEEFDLTTHAQNMKLKHPDWTDRQCRNLLYWQGEVRARLFSKVLGLNLPLTFVLDIPEANGVNVFETMALVGVQIDRHPDIVRKVMLLGTMGNLDTL